MHTDVLELKKFLVESRLISKADVDLLWTEAKEDENKFADLVISNGKISEDDFRKAKAYVLGIPYVDLKKNKIDRTILTLIPEPIARRHNIIAYARSDKGLEVAMLDPGDLQAIDFIRKGVGAKVLPRLTDSESIKHSLLQYQKSLKAEFGDIIQQEASNLAVGGDLNSTSAEELKKMAEDLPVVRIVDTLLSHAVSQKASDIHIEPFEKDLVIRYRIDGLLHDAMILPKSAASGLTARIKVLANLRLDEKRLPQDGRFKTDLSGQTVALRVSTLPTYFGEKIVMRLLPDSVKGFSLEGSGFHGEGLERVHKAMRASTGMILVTGPTG